MQEIPEWVDRTPYEAGKVYAIGIAGRTFYPEDGPRNAGEEARKELAKSIEGRITNILVSLESSDGQRFVNEAFTLEATTWAMEIVIQNAQILSTWCDVYGTVPGGTPMTTYALAVIDLGSIKTDTPDEIDGKLGEEKANELLDRLSASP